MILPLTLTRLRFRVGFATVAAMIGAVANAGVGVWTTNGPPGGAYSVITDPGTPGIVYAGSNGPFFGLTKSTDNGATWVSAGITGIATPVAAVTPATVYADALTADSQDTLSVSSDGGLHWRVLASGVFGTSYDVAVDPVTPTILYLVTDFAHGITAGSGLQRSTDGGMTWSNGVGLDGNITSIVIAPSSPTTLYAATAPLEFPPPLGGPAGGPVGLKRSIDSGATWMLLSTTPQDVNGLVLDPTNSLIVYAATNSLGVLKSVDGGFTFLSSSSGLPNAQVRALCIDPHTPSRLYAGTEAGVFVSSDGAANWSGLNVGLTDLDVFGLALDSTGKYLHAATQSGVFDNQVHLATCPADTHTLCLNADRFAVAADFQSTSQGPSTSATAVPLTSDTGYFWFFDPSNIELVVKVLTGCSVNGDYWVFAGGLTDVGVALKVTDTLTDAVKSYSNSVGTPFQPIQDSSAFPCP
jgi:hypothetical protein